MAGSNNIPQMNWSGDNVTENFRLFKHKLQLYFEDEEITDKVKQARKILRAIGDEGLRRLYGSALTEEDQKDPDMLFAFFKSQLPAQSVNFRIHRLQLMRFQINNSESIDNFVTRVRSHAVKCDFGDDNELQERIIELVIASTPYEEFRKELLTKEKGFTIKETLELGRKYEAIAESTVQLKQMHISEPESGNIAAIRTSHKTKSKPCSNCGRVHKKRQCPAYNSNCDECGKKGHWASVCRSSDKPDKRHKSRTRSSQRRQERYRRHSRSKSPQRNRSESKSNVDAIEYETVLDTINIDSFERREAFTTLPCKLPTAKKTVGVKLKLDTGASGNTIPLRMLKQVYSENELNKILDKELIKLTAYNGEPIEYLGSVNAKLFWGEKWFDTKLYVVNVTEKTPAVLGLKSCEEMGLVSVNVSSIKEPKSIDSVDALRKHYPEQFDTIGRFEGTAKLHLKDDAQPFVAAPRKCPINLKDKIKDELESMEEKGVIRKISEHTEWVSSVCFVAKPNGSLRVCLDPKKLNENLKRCVHKIPTVEELNPLFAGAKYFSKLDAKAGYWSVVLDEGSQPLTTFRSPLGQRYCFTRLPFGLNVSQDIFQEKMDEILEDLEGVVSIADDVCVTGKTEEEHDQNLVNLMERAKSKGLVFNSDKCAIKQESITFFGNVYSAKGISPDPGKVEDIQEMPAPQNKDELRRFLGMLTYLSQFIPHFSDRCTVLRDLLKQDTPWFWDKEHQQAFEFIKGTISDKSTLQYFDTNKPVTLEVDASQRGLGVAVLQDNHPVAYASRALTDTQSRYSNIEREMLAIVFGCERFHHLLYGKSFTVITDHKPLVTIHQKPIHAAPARLQRMLLRIQGYNVSITYRPGTQMIVADALSRLPNPNKSGDMDTNVIVHTIDENPEFLREISMINVSKERQIQIQTETARDATLNALKDVIYTGWPENIKGLTQDLRPFWPYREELAVEAGVVFKGKQILIPETLRDDIMQKLHYSHMGIEKTRRLSRESVFWPNINKDIEKTCKQCPLCQEFQNKNKKEPLEPLEVPSQPWQYVSSDMFEIRGKHFLLICDKFSKFPLVDEAPEQATSQWVADTCKKYFSIFGKPQAMYTDNGPQFNGQAFKNFLKAWDITHITSSPMYPQSNGFIERQVGYVKPLIEKAMINGQDISLVLLNIRATPIDTKLKSPAELLFQRPVTTLLPRRSEAGNELEREALLQRRDAMVEYDCESSVKTPLPSLHPGQKVRILSNKNKRWFPGTIISSDGHPRSYKISTNNRIIRRNRSHIRPIVVSTPSQAQNRPVSPISTPKLGESEGKIRSMAPRVLFHSPSPGQNIEFSDNKSSKDVKRVSFSKNNQVRIIPPRVSPENPSKVQTRSSSQSHKCAKSAIASKKISADGPSVTTRSGRVCRPNPKFQI